MLIHHVASKRIPVSDELLRKFLKASLTKPNCVQEVEISTWARRPPRVTKTHTKATGGWDRACPLITGFRP